MMLVDAPSCVLVDVGPSGNLIIAIPVLGLWN